MIDWNMVWLFMALMSLVALLIALGEINKSILKLIEVIRTDKVITKLALNNAYGKYPRLNSED